MTDINTERNISDRETHPRVSDKLGKAIELYLTTADRLASVIWALAIGMATLLTLIVVTQVVSRYVLGYITTWGNELARYLTIWFSMLLLGVLIYTDSHLQVEIVFQKLSLRARRAIRSAQLLLVIGFAGVLTVRGYEWVSTSGFYSTTPALESVTPFEFYMAYMYAVVPISGALVIFFTFAKLLEINYYPDKIDEDYASRFVIDDAEDETEATTRDSTGGANHEVGAEDRHDGDAVETERGDDDA